jgi:integrase/recombinase XerD
MSRKGKARVLSLPEFKRVEGVINLKKHAARNKAILYLSFGLGLRACEIRGLKICDVLERDTETLKETIVLTKTKGDKVREVYLTNKKLIQALQDHLKEMKFYLKVKKRNMPFILTNPLFVSQKGGEFCKTEIVCLFNKFFKDAGIEGARSHSGRRTFITTKIDEGCDIKAISELVGHSNISQTVQYHQSNPTRLKKISERSIF